MCLLKRALNPLITVEQNCCIKVLDTIWFVMRILFLGDVVGRTGRQAILNNLELVRKELNIDFIIVNAENATSGAGISSTHASQMLEAGVDCITLGDHSFDQRDMIQFSEKEKRIVRPLNYAKSAPGFGSRLLNITSTEKVLVVQVLGQVFMKRPFSDPFEALDLELTKYNLGGNVSAIFVDVHAEATSEKNALAQYFDGRVSIIAGTHTHIPTADLRILPMGTAYQTDVGMCGDYQGVIGMDKVEPIRRFRTGMVKERFKPACGEATLSGLIADIGSDGKAESVIPFRYKGVLDQFGMN